MRLAPLAFLTTLLHVFLAVRLLPALAQATGAWPVFAVLLVLSAVTMPLPFMQRFPLPPALRAPVRWFGLLAMGWFSSLFVLAVLRDIGLLSAWAITRMADLPLARAPWEQGSALAVMALATAGSLVGFFFARRTPPVRRVEVPIAGLPARLAGFTIAQLSDLHVGPTIRAGYIARIVEEVNRLGADMVAITGDLVDGSVTELRDHVAPLARLRARHGTFVVTGNHEYYAGAHAWVAELRRLGLNVLLNEHVVLQTRSVHGAQTDEEILDSALLVAGVTDYTAGHFDAAHESDPQAALRDAPPMVATRILLAHQPRSAPAAAEAGFQLQLSGHTHGGQFFPWNLFVPLQQPFTAGLHRLQDMWIYVSRGTGYWGPPQRLGAPSEITLVTLRRGAE